jgi:hypothetical protein
VLADSYSQLVDGIPKNVSYIYRDHNLKSARRIRLQVDSVNERVWVVDIASSKTPKTLGDRHVDGLTRSLIRHCTVLDLDRSYYCLRKRCIASVYILLILLEPSSTEPKEQRMWLRTGACGATDHVCMGPSTVAAMPVVWAPLKS